MLQLLTPLFYAKSPVSARDLASYSVFTESTYTEKKNTVMDPGDSPGGPSNYLIHDIDFLYYFMQRALHNLTMVYNY